MKKIAFLLFIMFAAVQVAPAVKAFFSETSLVFVADEEKGEEKSNTSDFKIKKDYVVFATHSFNFSHQINTAFHVAEKIHPSPCLLDLTPPPDFC
jgi:hypothetical protein